MKRIGMPIDEALQRRFHLVDGIRSHNDLSDPQLLQKFEQFHREDLPYSRPETICEEHAVAGPTGVFRVRTYTPDVPTGAGRAALVWAHGGGFIGGDLDMAEGDLVSREITQRANAVVISVDYDLARGITSYPTPHMQVTSAVRWVRKNGSNLGISPSQVFLGGASAGGNLAVAATLELRQATELLPAGLLLAYPFLHRKLDVQPELEKLLAGVPPLFRFTQTDVDFMYGAYLKDVADTPYASLENNNLTGFPPSMVILSEYDDLRPSGEAYAKQAKADGVQVETYLARGMLHGHLNRIPAVPEVDSSLNRMVSFLISRS